jgi:cytochrome b
VGGAVGGSVGGGAVVGASVGGGGAAVVVVVVVVVVLVVVVLVFEVLGTETARFTAAFVASVQHHRYNPPRSHSRQPRAVEGNAS